MLKYTELVEMDFVLTNASGVHAVPITVLDPLPQRTAGSQRVSTRGMLPAG
ncbi:hypothetical protein ES703_44470 [subsurface metagenome]